MGYNPKIGEIYRIPDVPTSARYEVIGFDNFKGIIVKLIGDTSETRWNMSDCEKDVLDKEYVVMQILKRIDDAESR